MTTYYRGQRVSLKTSQRDIKPYSGTVLDVGALLFPRNGDTVRRLIIKFDNIPAESLQFSNNPLLSPWFGENPFDLEPVE